MQLVRPSFRPLSRAAVAALAVAALGLTGFAPATAAPQTTSTQAPPSGTALPEAALPAPAQSRAVEAADARADLPLDPFYAFPAELPQEPAALVKEEPSAFYLGPARGVRLGAAQSRIMYTTTSSDGAIVPVTGSFLESGARWSGQGPRPLITYAVGTQGVANECAPSHQGAAGTEYEAAAINSLLLAGYDVVVTDYIGLGTEGPHTYMNRLDQGHAVLDAARAVRDAGLGGITAQTPVGIVGYSQGGGASAAAAEQAPTYAPDLRVRAAAVGAPPADLHQVAAQIDSGLYNGFLMYTLSGLLEAQGVSPASFLNARGLQLYTDTVGECTVSAIAPSALVPTGQLTTSGRSVSELTHTEPFRSIVAQQQLGVAGAPTAPTLVVHSVSDDVIPYQAGRQLATRWCAQGSTVQFAPTLGAGHIGGYATSQAHIQTFLRDQFAGRAPVSTCGRA